MKLEYIYIFHQANVFKRAFEILREDHLLRIERMIKFEEYYQDNGFDLNYYLSLNSNLNILSPLVVNGSFAIELYLKTLIKFENNFDLKARGHEIKKLYQTLNIIHQDSIRRKLSEVGYDVSNFETDILLIDKSFIEFRYIYEQGKVEVNFDFINNLIQILNEYINEII